MFASTDLFNWFVLFLLTIWAIVIYSTNGLLCKMSRSEFLFAKVCFVIIFKNFLSF